MQAHMHAQLQLQCALSLTHTFLLPRLPTTHLIHSDSLPGLIPCYIAVATLNSCNEITSHELRSRGKITVWWS